MRKKRKVLRGKLNLQPGSIHCADEADETERGNFVFIFINFLIQIKYEEKEL